MFDCIAMCKRYIVIVGVVKVQRAKRPGAPTPDFAKTSEFPLDGGGEFEPAIPLGED